MPWPFGEASKWKSFKKSRAVRVSKGLEILRLPEAGGSLVLSTDNLQSKFESRARGLSWGKTRDSLALELFSKETGEYELGTISTDGTNVQSISPQAKGGEAYSLLVPQNIAFHPEVSQ